MPVVYLKNKRSKDKKGLAIFLVALGVLLTVVGVGIWYLRQQQIATQQEAGGETVEAHRLALSGKPEMEKCLRGSCTVTSKEAADAARRKAEELWDQAERSMDPIEQDRLRSEAASYERTAERLEQVDEVYGDDNKDTKYAPTYTGKLKLYNPDGTPHESTNNTSGGGGGSSKSKGGSSSSGGSGDKVPDSCKSPPYDSCYATQRSAGCKAGYAPNSLCGPDNSWMYCCPGEPRTYGGGGSSSSGGGSKSCNPNYVIPVSLQSFSQTSGICFNDTNYEASYQVVVKAGNAQGECGGGYYKLVIRFPSSFGYGYVKSVQGPRITYSSGGAGVLNIRGWTYDNTSRTITFSISVPKDRIHSAQFQVAAVLSSDQHTSGNGTKYVTSNSDGCYVLTSQQENTNSSSASEGSSGSSGGSSGGTSPNTTPPPTPEGVWGNLFGIMFGLGLLGIGVLDAQYGVISRWLQEQKDW